MLRPLARPSGHAEMCDRSAILNLNGSAVGCQLARPISAIVQDMSIGATTRAISIPLEFGLDADPLMIPGHDEKIVANSLVVQQVNVSKRAPMRTINNVPLFIYRR